MIRVEDWRNAIRSLQRAPGFAALAVGVDAIAVGAVTAVFALVSAVILTPLPYFQPTTLWQPYLTHAGGDRLGPGDHYPFSYPKFEQFERSESAFAELAAFVDQHVNRTGTAKPERVEAEFVTPSYFGVLATRPELGRLFTPGSEDVAGGVRSVLLAHDYWKRSFGADPAVVGRTIELGHRSFTVVGVLPASFAPLTGKTDIWLPLASLPEMWAWPDALREPGSHFLHVVARALPGLSPEAWRASVAKAGREVAAAYPTPAKYDDGALWGADAETLASARSDRNLRRSLAVLFAAVAGVLLVACANIAALQLARAVSRRRELAVRSALGASRARLLGHELAESLLIAGLGGALGLAIAGAAMRGLVASAPAALTTWGLEGADLDNLLGAHLDFRVLGFAVATTLVAALFGGIAPALAAARTDPAAAIREGGASLAGADGHGKNRARRLLVVGQTAAAIVLLVGAGLLLRTLSTLLGIDPGYHAENVLTVHVVPSGGDFDPSTAPGFHASLLEAAASVPGVISATLGTCAPLSGNCNSTVVREIDGDAIPRPKAPEVGSHNVGPGFFRTLGIRLISGREFSGADRPGAPRVAILSRSAARALFGGEDPVGHHLGIGMNMKAGEQAEVIGVVDDVHYTGLAEPPAKDVYLADLQSGWDSTTLFVRTTGEPLAVLPALRGAVQRIAPDVPLYGVRTLREIAERSSSRTRFASRLLGLFALVALLLAGLGIYGVVAQMVADRRRELGLRMALGADATRLRRLVVRHALALALAGAAIGIPLAVALSRALASFLYGVRPTDPVTYASVALAVLAAAAAAAWLPARRAGRLDPARVLRES